ncbi:MAG: hypothetical protein ABIC95_05360 [archaeon]
MNKHFVDIKRVYDSFIAAQLKKGRMPIRDTGIGYWGISDLHELYQAFSVLHLDDYERFLDLGSGDGRAVMVAGLFTSAEGVEYDKWLHEVSTDIKSKLKKSPAAKRVTFHNKDFLTHDISPYDFIFLAPDKPAYRGLNPKLKAELNGHLAVWGHHFQPQQLRQEASIHIGQGVVTVYSNPIHPKPLPQALSAPILPGADPQAGAEMRSFLG